MSEEKYRKKFSPFLNRLESLKKGRVPAMVRIRDNKKAKAYERMDKVLTSERGMAFIDYVRQTPSLNADHCLNDLAGLAETLKEQPKSIIRLINAAMVLRIQSRTRRADIPMSADVQRAKKWAIDKTEVREPSWEIIQECELMYGDLGQLIPWRPTFVPLRYFTDEHHQGQNQDTTATGRFMKDIPLMPKHSEKRKADLANEAVNEISKKSSQGRSSTKNRDLSSPAVHPKYCAKSFEEYSDDVDEEAEEQAEEVDELSDAPNEDS
jgi:hypothetical protein